VGCVRRVVVREAVGVTGEVEGDGVEGLGLLNSRCSLTSIREFYIKQGMVMALWTDTCIKEHPGLHPLIDAHSLTVREASCKVFRTVCLL
jgi:hypothetical protein